VIPQMKGWLREGIISSYSLFLNRYYAGKPWDALLVLEYKDLESFGRRESIMARVRETLKRRSEVEGYQRKQEEYSNGEGTSDRQRA